MKEYPKQRLDSLFEQFNGKEPFEVKQIDARLWNRLENRIKAEKRKKKLRFYRAFSAAAFIALLIISVGIFNHFIKKHNPNLFAANASGGTFIIEELEYNTKESFYNTASFKKIREAYQEAFNPGIELGFTGKFISEDGSIGFTILLSNYSLNLEFSENSLPRLELAGKEGSQVIFSSVQGYILTLSKNSTHKFQMVSSNFLPEYDGMIFRKISEI